jgi:hypothetical protein
VRTLILRPDDPLWTGFLSRAPHDFYHLPGYVSLCAAQEQGRARALYVEDGDRAMLLPFLVRRIHGGGRDACSPYGYPGPLVSGGDDPGFIGHALARGMQALEIEGIVSLFVRLHPLLNPVPPPGVGTVVRHADTVAVDLSLPAEVLWSQTRRNHRAQINQAREAGYRFGVDLDPAHDLVFRRLYLATMARLGADRYYHFDDAYFDGLRAVLGDSLHLGVVELEGRVVAAGLFTEMCGIVQMHLTGADERATRHQPMKLVFDGVRAWAQQRGDHWLHLGGGRGGADDSLLHFKAGFSPLRRPYHTLRVVIMEDEYRRLVAHRSPSLDPADLAGHFPLYRRG